jgi:hypothetical protein
MIVSNWSCVVENVYVTAGATATGMRSFDEKEI